MKTEFKPIQTLNQRTFKKNRGRNLVAIIAILMTTIMFTTLFTLAQSMSKNMVEMTFRQTGYDGQTSFKSITAEQFSLIADHPDVAEAGESLVLGLAQNKKLGGNRLRSVGAVTSMLSIPSLCLPPEQCQRQQMRSHWTP